MTTIRTLADAHAYYVVGLGWPCVPDWMRDMLTGKAPKYELAPINKNDPWGVQAARERSPLDDIRAAAARNRR